MGEDAGQQALPGEHQPMPQGAGCPPCLPATVGPPGWWPARYLPTPQTPDGWLLIGGAVGLGLGWLLLRK